MKSLLLAAVLLAGACVVHRGPSWRPAPDAAQPSRGFSLVAIGNPGVPGKRAADVAARLRDVIADERTAGRRPIVLVLGDLVQPSRPRRDGQRCPQPAAAWRRPGTADLGAVLREHRAAGGDVFAAIGPADRACGLDTALHQADAAGPHPWAMPDDHYVVRIDRDGAARVVSQCDARGCRVEPADPERTALDLVVCDATAWLHPPTEKAARARADASVARLAALVAAATRDTGGPPRLLVGSVPVESAGVHGHGGRFGEATLHNFPDALAQAIVRGSFVGSIGAYDRGLYVAPDITDAIKRSDRTWIAAPMFQLVSGSASWSDAHPSAVGRRLRYFRGNAWRPAVYSDHLGFAVLRPQHDRADFAQAELWARRRGRWQTERVTLPLAPLPHPVETPSPVMTPCTDCPAIPVHERQ